jgi:hypothetical protein
MSHYTVHLDVSLANMTAKSEDDAIKDAFRIVEAIRADLLELGITFHVGYYNSEEID